MNFTTSPAHPNVHRSGPRIKRRWVLLFVALFSFSQLLILPHEFTHPLFGSDGACKICLLSNAVTPPASALTPVPPVLIAIPVATRTRVAATRSIDLNSTHPRAPPLFS